MFRLLDVGGRPALEGDGTWHDVARLSGDASLATAEACLARSAELHELSARCTPANADGALADVVLGPPVPRPGQVFGIGLNYRDHAAETGAPLPPAPLTFTKFPSCIAGPTADIPLTGDAVDWEVELVAVIGQTCSSVPVAEAWGVVAGLMLGQDVSDRTVQRAGVPPQFSLGKSFPSFGPTGPAVVSLDHFADPDDIALSCEVSGEVVQSSTSAQLIFTIPQLVAYLSSVCTLSPGDLIFTGTPAGVGMSRGRFLAPGEVVVSRADGIGQLRNTCVPGRGPLAL